MERSLLDSVLEGDFDAEKFYETITKDANNIENEWVEVETEDGKSELVKVK